MENQYRTFFHGKRASSNNFSIVTFNFYAALEFLWPKIMTQKFQSNKEIWMKFHPTKEWVTEYEHKRRV